MPNCIAENLDFDVTRIANELFDVEPSVFEARLGLRGRTRIRAMQLARIGNDAHPSPPPPAVALSNTG